MTTQDTTTIQPTGRSEPGAHGERLKGRVAFVTGGTRGIGSAICRSLARESATIAAGFAGNERAANKFKEEFGAQYGTPLSLHQGNIGDSADCRRTIQEVIKTHGRLDILVNNAAMLGRRPFLELEPALWDEVMAVNLRGAYLCARAAFRQMAGQQPSGGSIVNLSSLSGVRGPEKFPGLAAYNVSKAGILALSDILAVEGKPHGIRVNTVSPGAVETEMLRQAGHGLKALATPEDVARTIAFLVSDLSQPATGANLEILSNA
jgi:NAD(P)-dependent dehydrogenase (short-subunit alcohol dehydrogenase family)